MYRIGAGVCTITLSVLLFGLSTHGAHAYLDAGTGSIILQVLLGGLAGLTVAGKLYWHKILSMMGIRQGVTQSSRVKDESLAPSETVVDK